jgi:hypothetical protein
MSTVFMLMTGEWVDAMEPATRTFGPSACVYFIGVLLLGRYLIVNLFIGILLKSFSTYEDEGDAAAPAATNYEPLTMAEAPMAADAGASAEVAAEKEADADAEAPLRWPADYACCLFGPSHPLRRSCAGIVGHAHFEPLVMAMIITSCVCLGLDSPRLPPDSTLAVSLSVLDVCWTLLFTSELTLKAIAYGFACGEKA